jgi:CheY-like chemotaxis protein
MLKAGLNGIERRAAERYRVPGTARVFWAGSCSEAVALSDMSASGCQVVGARLPGIGTRVFLSLELGGLPNLRLPATVMRRVESSSEMACGLHFALPIERLAGLARLLDQTTRSQESGLLPVLPVLVVDSEDRSRARVALAVSRAGARVIAVSNAIDAVRSARETPIGVALVRADCEGLAALAALAQESSSTFRVAFGRGSALNTAVTLGFAEATADDPCSAKCLSDLMQRRSAPHA